MESVGILDLDPYGGQCPQFVTLNPEPWTLNPEPGTDIYCLLPGMRSGRMMNMRIPARATTDAAT